MDKYCIMEDLIKSYLPINDIVEITGSSIEENRLGVYVKVYYTITEEYALKHDLYYRKRSLSILLKRNPGNEGCVISSQAVLP